MKKLNVLDFDSRVDYINARTLQELAVKWAKGKDKHELTAFVSTFGTEHFDWAIWWGRMQTEQFEALCLEAAKDRLEVLE